MPDQIVYAQNSILDTRHYDLIDEVGDVGVDEYGNVTLGPSSSCAVSRTYNTSDVLIQPDILKLVTEVVSNNQSIITRYNPLIKISLEIIYYTPTVSNEGIITGYTEGTNVIIDLYPYINDEDDINVGNYEIPIDSAFIKSIKLVLENNLSTFNITFRSTKLYNNVSIDKAIEEKVIQINNGDGSSGTVNIYKIEGYPLNMIGIVGASGQEVRIKPTYVGNKLNKIETNQRTTLNFVYIEEEGSLI